ncbi:UDP-glucose--hexose-1-phosphate uridylyltransferase [Haploplasma modicum]|uniref:UDP-glucose--hexose-1-phosphate uridylyltransferase n=1 Tax=Haploplasma modicum TaxID=2150 RepID=UPI00138AE721|nr:UDP-glucose--hexose-1-phosphate uridylyltransferase [Haploplasma modicum]
MRQDIENLINYEIKNNVITKRDYIYVKNQIYGLLNLELDYKEYKPVDILYPSDALNNILDKLEASNMLDGSQTARDLFDSKIMNVFAKLPSTIQNDFDLLKSTNNKLATRNLYEYVTHLNYIRKDRIDKNIAFKRASKYGFLEITINLSKPEKDPKSIAMALNAKQSEYPKCLLCKENEGFLGNFSRDSRNQHRLIQFNLKDEKWFFQYSPYIYYNEHAIVFSDSHHPMKIENKTFERLLDLTDEFDGYFFGSNADLPIVGGSILTHEHYQGGSHVFPIELASSLYEKNIDNTIFKILNWPLSTIRIESKKKEKVLLFANKILETWKNYSNQELNIKAYTNEVPHHTITPIARKKDNKYVLDLILRDNQTSIKHPGGIYHPHEDKWHIKKENIGLIEAIGLAILPGRLKDELEDVKDYLLFDKKLNDNSIKHQKWADSFKALATKENIDELIESELSKKFEEILEDCGVFKLNDLGINQFIKYLEGVIL